MQNFIESVKKLSFGAGLTIAGFAVGGVSLAVIGVYFVCPRYKLNSYEAELKKASGAKTAFSILDRISQLYSRPNFMQFKYSTGEECEILSKIALWYPGYPQVMEIFEREISKIESAKVCEAFRDYFIYLYTSKHQKLLSSRIFYGAVGYSSLILSTFIVISFPFTLFQIHRKK